MAASAAFGDSQPDPSPFVPKEMAFSGIDLCGGPAGGVDGAGEGQDIGAYELQWATYLTSAGDAGAGQADLTHTFRVSVPYDGQDDEVCGGTDCNDDPACA
mgnify:CR=1 FL=1